MNKCNKFVFLLFFIQFLIVGISIGIPGSTIYFFEQNSVAREDEASLVFTGRAVGSLGGWLLSSHILSINQNIQPNFYCINIGLFGLMFANLWIPWSSEIWWLMAAFSLQGFSISIVIQGMLSFIWKTNKSQKSAVLWHQLMVLFGLFGCCISPSVVSQNLKQSNIASDNLESSVSTKFIVPINNTLDVKIRLPRSIDSAHNRTTSMTPKFLEHSSILTTTTRPGNMTDMAIISTTNKTIPVSFNSTVKPPVSITSTKAPMKKPIVNDAKHLSQDQKTADGSIVSSVMKKIDDNKHIVDVAKNQKSNKKVIPIVVETKKHPKIPVQKIKNTKKSIITTTTTVGPEIIEQLNKTSTIVVPTLKMAQQSTSHSPLVHNKIKRNETEMNPSKVTEIKKEVENKPLKTEKIKTKEEPVKNITGTTPEAKYVPRQHNLVGKKPEPPFKALSRILSKPLDFLQKVYLLVFGITVIGWILTVPLTGVLGKSCCRIDCISFTSDNNDDMEEEIPMYSNAFVSSNKQENQSLLKAMENGACSSDSGDDQDEVELFNSAPLPKQQKQSVVTASLEKRDSISFGANNVFEGGDLLAAWPKVCLPEQLWLIVAGFVHSGLETAYGGFIHSFSIMYLQWSQKNALLVTSMFWLGNLVGRMLSMPVISSYLCSHARSPCASDDLPNRQMRSALCCRVCRSLTSSARMLGACICVFSASLMVAFSANAKPAFLAVASDKSPFVWGSLWHGSIGLGLGLGLAGGAGFFRPLEITQENKNRMSKRRRGMGGERTLFEHTGASDCVQIAALFGQMVLPAVAAYAHRRVGASRASSALGLTSLVLSCALLACLIVDAASLCVSRRSSNRAPSASSSNPRSRIKYKRSPTQPLHNGFS